MEPAKLAELLAQARQDAPGPRRHPCSRCSRLESEYTRHDPSWTPPEATSYVHNGIRYWMHGCEPCLQHEFLERWDKRRASAAAESDEEKKLYKLSKLEVERARFFEAQRMRKAQQTSGAPAIVEASAQAHLAAARGSGEAALTLEQRRSDPGLGCTSSHAVTASSARQAPPADGSEEPAPDYAPDGEEWPF